MRWSNVLQSLRKPRPSPRWLHRLVRGLRAVVWALGITYLLAGVVVALNMALSRIPACTPRGLDERFVPSAACQYAQAALEPLNGLVWVFYPFWWLFGGE